WPVCAMIARSDLPAFAAAVARPARREWPPNVDASRPTAAAPRWTTRATPRPDRRPRRAPCRETPRKIRPSVLPPAPTHPPTGPPAAAAARGSPRGRRADRDPERAAGALLSGFRAPERQREAIRPGGHVLEIEAHEFRAPERRGKAHEEERPIPQAEQTGRRRR